MLGRPLTILALLGGLAFASAASAQTVPGPASPAPAPEAPLTPEPAAPPSAAADSVPVAAESAPVVAGSAPVAVAAESAPVAGPSRAGFEALASVGYGLITEVERADLQPYAASFGLDLGYSFDFGLHLGVELSYGLGQQKEQSYETMGRERELTIDSHSVSAFLSVGYDLWLHFLILRYSLGLGATWLSWELGNIEGSFEGYTAPTGSVTSFVLVPGLLLLWPLEPFEIGLGFDYFFQADVQTPSGIVTQLVLGVKL